LIIFDFAMHLICKKLADVGYFSCKYTIGIPFGFEL
jgi:hypothetical protein